MPELGAGPQSLLSLAAGAYWSAPFTSGLWQLQARCRAEGAAAVGANEGGRAGLGVGVAGFSAKAVLRADPRFSNTERTRRARRGHGAGVASASFAYRSPGHARAFLFDVRAVGGGVARGSSTQGLGVRLPAIGGIVRTIRQDEADERRPADP